DFIDSVQTLPNEIKRNFELMRTLDKNAKEAMSEISETEKQYLGRARRKLQERSNSDIDGSKLIEEPETMALLEAKRMKARQMVDEKVAIAEQTYEMVEPYLKRIRLDAVTLEEKLKAAAGEVEVVVSGGAKPNDEVAMKLDVLEDLWVLARVLDYSADTGEYQVMDADDNTKKYVLPEQQVVLLEGKSVRVAKGEHVYAVYPETTSFYRAVVVVAPRRPGPV
ncbi:unnamed protein product, partial [Phaeothamnion confervicola]